MTRAIAALLMTLALAAGAQDAPEPAAPMQLQVVQLRHRTAEMLVPVLRPLAVAGATVSGMNDRLILRSTAANLAELMVVVDELDRPARRVLITVRHAIDTAGGASDAALAARLHGDGGGTGAAIDLRALQTRDAGSERNEQRIQAVEGAPAFISTGQSVPLADRTVVQGPGGAWVQDSVTYRDLQSGVWVLPRLAGDTVTLEISPRRERLDPRQGGVIDLGAAMTTVSGRLGEWIALGGVNEAYDTSGGGYAASTRRAGSTAQGLWVRIDELP